MHALQQFLLDFARLALWLALLAAVFVPLERFFANPPRGAKSPLPGEIGYYFLNNLLPAMLLAAPLALLAATSRKLLPDVWLSLLAATPFAIKLLISLFLSELCSYWGHRVSHEWPFLWQFHSRHHQPEQVNWLTNSHNHPIDILWARITALFPIYALGFAEPVAGRDNLIPILLLFFAAFWSFFIHANVRWRLGPLEHLIVTPAFHHWHHTNDEWRDHNYATLLPVMDRLFGTHHLPAEFPPSYGIDNPADMAPLLPFAPKAAPAAKPEPAAQQPEA